MCGGVYCTVRNYGITIMGALFVVGNGVASVPSPPMAVLEEHRFSSTDRTTGLFHLYTHYYCINCLLEFKAKASREPDRARAGRVMVRI